MNPSQVTKPFVLKEDILLVPCAELHAELRVRLSFDEGDFTLSQRSGRATSQVIDGQTAALLQLFREPRTIVEAVVESGRALGKDPHAWLAELLPHLGAFIDEHILVPAGSPDGKAVQPRFRRGTAFHEWEIVRCISAFEDTEVYELRGGGRAAALKIARSATPQLRAEFANETAVLRHLDGSGIAPPLLGAGTHEKRPYAILGWAAGVEVFVAAAQRRHDRVSMLALCASIAAAYAALHERGVLHADIHARNVLAGDAGVTLLDFAASRLAGRRARVGRSGIRLFFEPEWFTTRRLSPAGEQYSVATLLYLLITDHHYLDFRLDSEELEQQLQQDAPLPFAKRGIAPWPTVERILFRALEKDPARRFGSMSEMATALAAERDRAARRALARPLSAKAHAFLDATLRSFARGGAMFARGCPAPPAASVCCGAAGAAVGLLRIAEVRGDSALLALADVWCSRAAARIGSSGAYYDDERGLGRDVVGDTTPYHTESGIHAAAAMIAAARGDAGTQRDAILRFLRASSQPCKFIELMFGHSGSLVAAALLLEISGDLPAEADALRNFGAEAMRTIWSELDATPPLASAPVATPLSMVHGWAGYLYATLRWCAASGDAPPPRLAERLHEYAALKQTNGRGIYWAPRAGIPANHAVPQWCNGSAGVLFVLTLAHRLIGGDPWLRLAERCAWNAWDEPWDNERLCCGTAGRAYALLNFYKHTGAAEWLSRARRLASHAAAIVPEPRDAGTLWRGELGVATLIADLESPENARMPFFE